MGASFPLSGIRAKSLAPSPASLPAAMRRGSSAQSAIVAGLACLQLPTGARSPAQLPPSPYYPRTGGAVGVRARRRRHGVLGLDAERSDRRCAAEGRGTRIGHLRTRCRSFRMVDARPREKEPPASGRRQPAGLPPATVRSHPVRNTLRTSVVRHAGSEQCDVRTRLRRARHRSSLLNGASTAFSHPQRGRSRGASRT